MKYYLIDTCVLKDGTNPVAIMAYADKNQAISAWHYTMSSKMANENVVSAYVAVINEFGAVEKKERYDAVIEPEPEPEEPEEA